jgi:glycosyltransferase involved in cell wall biosynthesis
MVKKILFANGRPTPPITLGGDSVCANILLKHLVDRGYKCFAFGTLNPEYSTQYNIHDTVDIRNRLKKLHISYKYVKNWLQVSLCDQAGSRYLAIKRMIEYIKPFYSRMIRTEFFSEELDKYIRQILPDIVITQVDKVTDVILSAKKYNIPVMVIIQDLELYNIANINVTNSYNKASILFISEAVKKQFANLCEVPNYIWYHPLDEKTMQSKNKLTKDYITMINPVFVKGGKIFHDVAQALPKMKFMAVTNWYDSKKDNIDFSDNKNVTIVTRQDDMSIVYKKTKLLLAPSLWQEAFGRVVIEAGLYGIPTIASNTGGLKEAVGNGGVVIKNYIDPKQWVAAIINSLKKDRYNKLSIQAYQHSLLFRADIQCRKFEMIMKKHF